MSQTIWSSINPSTTSGTDLAGILDDFKDAVVSGFSGTSRPSELTAGGYWIDSTNVGTPNFYYSYKMYDGSNDVEMFRLDITHSKIIFPSTTASRIVATDASNNLTSLTYASANTASAMVQRDGSGNFSAGTITATISGNVTGTVTGTASGNTTISGQTNHGVVVSGSANAMTSTAAGSSGQVLLSGGASADPTWGTAAIAHGGTGQTTKAGAFDALSAMSAVGDILYGGTAGTGTALAGNITTTKKFLTQTGNSSVSAAPAWGTIANTDLSGIVNAQLSGSAAITNANLATMNANTFKANNTGGSATPVDITIAQALTALGFTASTISAAGYIVLPGGLYVQWKGGGASTGGTTTSWPVNFPTACFGIVATATNQTGAGAAIQGVGSTTGFTLTNSTGTPSCFVIGVGN